MRIRIFTLLALLSASLVPAPAAATAGSCTFEDTSFANTSYTSGPGVLSSSGSSGGAISGSAHVRSSDASTDWGKATGRVNGARHHLDAGFWDVVFSYGAASGSLSYSDAAVEGVVRTGVQVEFFSESAITESVSASGDLITAPEQGSASEPAGAIIVHVDVADPGVDVDGLFFGDAHVRHDSNADIQATISWSGTSICWQKTANASASQTLLTARRLLGRT